MAFVPNETTAMWNYPKPRYYRQLGWLASPANFNRWFIPNCAEFGTPLVNLLREAKRKSKFRGAAKQALTNIKDAIMD